MNLLGKKSVKKKAANLVMNGYWSLKTEKEHKLMGVDVTRVNSDPAGLYFDVPEPSEWTFDPDAAYVHYTEAGLGMFVKNKARLGKMCNQKTATCVALVRARGQCCC